MINYLVSFLRSLGGAGTLDHSTTARYSSNMHLILDRMSHLHAMYFYAEEYDIREYSSRGHGLSYRTPKLMFKLAEGHQFHNVSSTSQPAVLDSRGHIYLDDLAERVLMSTPNIDLPLPSPSSCNVSSIGLRLFLRTCSVRSYSSTSASRAKPVILPPV